MYFWIDVMSCSFNNKHLLLAGTTLKKCFFFFKPISCFQGYDQNNLLKYQGNNFEKIKGNVETYKELTQPWKKSPDHGTAEEQVKKNYRNDSVAGIVFGN